MPSLADAAADDAEAAADGELRKEELKWSEHEFNDGEKETGKEWEGQDMMCFFLFPDFF